MPRIAPALVVVLSIVLAACGGGGEEAAGDGATPGAASGGAAATPAEGGADAAATAAQLAADLDGAAEVPGPGHPESTGSATVRLEGGSACVALQTDLEEAQGFHIHEGDADTAGPVVVDLTGALGSADEQCLDADAAVVERILAAPEGFYLNLHTGEFPDGAIRGQLAAA